MKEVKKWEAFAFIFNYKKGKTSILKMYKIFGVSETGYYKWKKKRNKPNNWHILPVKIFEILEENPDNQNYGINRMVIALNQKGEKMSRYMVKKAMLKGNLLHKSSRCPDGLTKADLKADKPENLIKQDFSTCKPNQKWLTDITEVPCIDAKLYLAPVLDCYAGDIVGLSMDTNMKKQLCVKAIKQAHKTYKPEPGLIAHSDAGSQKTE